MRETLRRVDQWAAQGDWLLPGRYSLADVALLPFVERRLCPELQTPQAGYATAAAWHAHMLARPAVQRALFFNEDPRAVELRNALSSKTC